MMEHEENLQNKTYLYYQHKDCDLLQDRPVLPSGKTVLTTAKIWSRVPEGLNAETDWLTVSRKVTLTD